MSLWISWLRSAYKSAAATGRQDKKLASGPEHGQNRLREPAHKPRRLSSSLENRIELVGVVSRESLYRGDRRGYGIVITKRAIIGAKKPDASPDFGAYLGPGSSPTDSLRRDAEALAASMIESKDFKVPVGAVGQLLFRAPGLFEGGYSIIKTPFDVFRVDTSVLYVDPGLVQASKTLAESFASVLGWRLCDSATGEPLVITR